MKEMFDSFLMNERKIILASFIMNERTKGFLFFLFAALRFLCGLLLAASFEDRIKDRKGQKAENGNDGVKHPGIHL